MGERMHNKSFSHYFLGICLFLWSTAAPVTAQNIVGFTLINAITSDIIVPMYDDQVIYLEETGSDLSILADVKGDTSLIGSMVMTLSQRVNGSAGDSTLLVTQLERNSPYALGGNIDNNYNRVNALKSTGRYEVSATAYEGTNGDGNIIGDTKTLRFRVVRKKKTDPPVAPAPVTVPTKPTPTPSQQPVVVAPMHTPSPVMPTTSTSTTSDVPAYPASIQGIVSGELHKWHKITIGFAGPYLSETDTSPNPFLDYRLTVVFSHASSAKEFTVPGYFAADGNAANTGASAGRVWLVHFSPDRIGDWTWRASFVQGSQVAITPPSRDDVSADFFDGASGSFTVTLPHETLDDRDLRQVGLLQYVGEHYYQFKEGPWFIRAGSDAPENLLAYDEFDNTPNYGERRKSWEPHAQDYNRGDPTWADGKGKGIVGAINYLSSMGMNAFSFLTMNIAGDDQNVFPYISDQPQDRLRFDVSKLAQWEVLFEHADHMGMYMHVKTQETENDQLLDGGDLGVERKLYYRELIARFSHHLALSWNLGEENTNTLEQREAFVAYFVSTDPYQHPIDLHTFPNDKRAEYTGLLGLSGFTGASLQSHPNNVHSDTLEWRQKSQDANQKWVVTNDEQNPADIGVLPDANDPSHDIIRIHAMWGNLMAGGSGVEYYFGYKYPDSDMTCQDFRSRENMWVQSNYALEFFHAHVPFWRMTPSDDLISGGNWMLVSDKQDVVLLYILPGSGPVTINLPQQNTYSIRWFDPRKGGSLHMGSVQTVSTDPTGSKIGSSPYAPDQDWAVLLTAISESALEVASVPTPQPTRKSKDKKMNKTRKVTSVAGKLRTGRRK